jgi:hypothetical protein
MRWGIEFIMRRAKRRARVAVARRLALIMHRMWTTGPSSARAVTARWRRSEKRKESTTKGSAAANASGTTRALRHRPTFCARAGNRPKDHVPGFSNRLCQRAPFSSLMQRVPGSGFSPGSIAMIAACLRWNGWVEVVFAVPVDRMPGSDLIRAASRQDASRELGWGWRRQILLRLRQWCGGTAPSSSTWRGG